VDADVEKASDDEPDEEGDGVEEPVAGASSVGRRRHAMRCGSHG
jgi:hypothetical protein